MGSRNASLVLLSTESQRMASHVVTAEVYRLFLGQPCRVVSDSRWQADQVLTIGRFQLFEG